MALNGLKKKDSNPKIRSKIIIFGVDHYFKSKGRANKIVVSQSDDENHFSPDYFGKGMMWGLPDLEGSEYVYQLADIAFKKENRKIYDATINGKLDIFEKITLEQALDMSFTRK